MNKIKQKIEQIKSNKKTKITVELIVMIMHVFLLAMMVLNLGYAWEVMFQTFKDYYLGKAVFLFLISLAVLQRVKIFNVVNLVFVVVYTFIVHKNMIVLVDSPELYNATVVKWACGGMICVLLIDMIMYKKIAKFSERRIVATSLYMIVAAVAFFASGGVHYSYLLLFPFVCMFLLKVEKERLQKWFFYLSLGYYGAFLYTMIKSFVTVPYTGERYYGIYVNHGIFGIFIGGAFVCSLWWFILLVKKKAPLWKKLLMMIPMGFVLVCSIMNGSRGAELAVIVVGFVAVCIWGGARNKGQMFYRVAVVSILACILLVLLFGGLYLLNGYDKVQIETKIANDVLREVVLYWKDRANTLFNAESKYGIFESGSIINAIDRFSSGRLSHWITYLKETQFTPGTDFYLEINGYNLSQPHNVYIYWLYGLGIIPGMGLIIWIIYYLVQAFRQTMKQNDMCILSFLWVVYFMVVGINDSITWVIPAGFITILLYYPLIIKFKDKDKEELGEGKNG